MTIVVYKNGVMASDGRMSDEDDSSIFTNKAQKIYRLKDGGLLGLAGDADHRAIVTLFDKVRGRKFPTSKAIIATGSDITGILVLKDNSMWYVSCGKKDKNEEWSAEVLEMRDGYAAIGSGAKYAYGAFDRGASARQAVLTAIKFDSACGGTPQEFKLEQDIE